MSKHTPGPWCWWTSNSVNRLSSDATGNDGDVLYATQYMDGTCDVVLPNGGSNGPDARLIAAAPELLEALREITDHFVDVMGGPLIASRVRFANGVEGIPTIAAARAAIAKATGGA